MSDAEEVLVAVMVLLIVAGAVALYHMNRLKRPPWR